MKAKNLSIFLFTFLSLFFLFSCITEDDIIPDVDSDISSNDEDPGETLDENKSDETVDESKETPDEQIEEPDLTEEVPDENENGAPTEGAYHQCDPAQVDSCPPGLQCIKGYDNAQYGQCLKPCNDNAECPPPPDPSMQVACHTKEKFCLILCGSFEGDCPDWLECFGQEMCLPPSSITATKGPGEICSGRDECIGNSDCIEGSSGIPYCYPLCDPAVPNDCENKAPGFQAQCTNAGGFSFCMFTCQGGVPCPGDLNCTFGFCQG